MTGRSVPRDLLVVGVRRLRGEPTRFEGPWASTDLADPVALADAVAAARSSAWQPRHDRLAWFELRVLDGRTTWQVRSGVEQVREAAPVPDLLRLVWHLTEPPLGAVGGLAALCELIAAADPHLAPHTFVERLGEQAAGISPGRAGWLDLARAGRNVIPGTGFAPAYDDGSPWQVRHFAGSAVACLRLGARATRWASVLRGDLPGSADHRLTARAIDLTTALLSGRVAPAAAGDWVRTHLAAPPPAGIVRYWLVLSRPADDHPVADYPGEGPRAHP